MTYLALHGGETLFVDLYVSLCRAFQTLCADGLLAVKAILSHVGGPFSYLCLADC